MFQSFKSIHNPIECFVHLINIYKEHPMRLWNRFSLFLKGIYRNEVGFMVLIRHLFEECNGEYTQFSRWIFSPFSSNHSTVYDSRLWERNHIVDVLLKKEWYQRKALAHCLRDFTLVFCSLIKSGSEYHLCSTNTSDTIVHAVVIKSQRTSVLMEEGIYQEISQLSNYKPRRVL